MKKSFTTIALFSLVLVATSFTTTETTTISTDTVHSAILPIDGGGQKVGQDKKVDIYSVGTNLGGFGSDSQSISNNKKID
ncbi:hypothetical protein [Flavobacterium hydatis]|jgi:hypothetical protein|uniref:Pectate lyase n=1 Tax=Flavobacterium hydatis TaxID=991 RepID=A0A086AUR8_FLAHY|nr:hypothetical protein [Flavobacterium hydatis]KFF20432.1 hypothetical protein IW20_01325 [Flavobacterium hydatis]OXA98285.1 hypothetical protein B0A62_00340 [Flavobacterium hydatis]